MGSFRGPGKRQFLAALDNYQPGTPRSFHEPSCHACGKIHEDTGHALLMCGGCKVAWFCDKAGFLTRLRRECHGANTLVQDCQRSLWSVHKHDCSRRNTPGPFTMLNV